MDTPSRLMVDFETLGTNEDAVILSVGLIPFSETEISDGHYMEFNVLDQIAAGRSVSRSTQEWWIKTNQDEFLKLLNSGSYHLSEVSHTLDEIGKIDEVWSRGCMDFHMLNHITGSRFPFYKARDVRTLDTFYSWKGKNKHNAYDDCLNQIEHFQKVMNDFRKED